MKKTVLLSLLCLLPALAMAQDRRKIRIIYPNAGALINGQLGHILEKTDILERNGLDAELVGFPYWPPMQEAMVSGNADVALASEACFVNIALKFPSTQIATVGSAGRVAIMVPPGSPAKKLSDLKGKSVTTVFGTSVHYPAFKWIRDAGLTPGKDIKVTHMSAGEGQAALAKGDIDAMTIWDPFVANMEQKKTGRVLVEKPSFLTTMIATDEFLKRDPEAAIRFLTALHEAVLYLHYNKDQANAWFSKTNGVPVDIIDRGSRYNTFYAKAKKMKDIDLTPGEDLLSLLENISAFNEENKLQVGKSPVREKNDPSYVKEARKRALAAKFDPKTVKVKVK